VYRHRASGGGASAGGSGRGGGVAGDFAKVVAVMEGVWLMLAVGAGVLSARQEATLVRRALVYLAEVMSASRRARSFVRVPCASR